MKPSEFHERILAIKKELTRADDFYAARNDECLKSLTEVDDQLRGLTQDVTARINLSRSPN